MLNWAMKGVTTERHAKKTPAEVVASPSQPIAEPMPAPVQRETPAEKASAVLFNYQSPQPQNSGFNSAFNGGTIGNRHILVVAPKSDHDVIGIVEHLKTNEAVIVNFEGSPHAETQRRIDFLSGVACALGGAICPLDTFKYIITPSGIGVR